MIKYQMTNGSTLNDEKVTDVISSAETPEGVYASIPGFQMSEQNSAEYKVVYDYVAQVSV